MKRSKGYNEARTKVEKGKAHTLDEAVKLLRDSARAKFDETVEASVRLGVDPRKADQMVRGTTVLPHGTGKKIKVLVLAKGDKAKEAEEADQRKAAQRELRKYRKRMRETKACEARALLKERFDYPIFLYGAEEVGITATGEVDANELYPNERMPVGMNSEETCLELYPRFRKNPTEFLLAGEGS